MHENDILTDEDIEEMAMLLRSLVDQKLAAIDDAPDYACGGVETSEPSMDEWLREMGWTTERREANIGYSITRKTAVPDIMSAVRDVARGS